MSLGCHTHTHTHTQHTTHTVSDVAVKLMGHDSDGSLFSQSTDSDNMLLKNSLSYVYKKTSLYDTHCAVTKEGVVLATHFVPPSYRLLTLIEIHNNTIT